MTRASTASNSPGLTLQWKRIGAMHSCETSIMSAWLVLSSQRWQWRNYAVEQRGAYNPYPLQVHCGRLGIPLRGKPRRGGNLHCYQDSCRVHLANEPCVNQEWVTRGSLDASFSHKFGAAVLESRQRLAKAPVEMLAIFGVVRQNCRDLPYTQGAYHFKLQQKDSERLQTWCRNGTQKVIIIRIRYRCSGGMSEENPKSCASKPAKSGGICSNLFQANLIGVRKWTKFAP